MLRHRVQSAAIMIALTAGAFLLPPYGVLVVLLIFCGLCMSEYYDMLSGKNLSHFPVLGMVGGLGLIVLTFLELYLLDGRAKFESESAWLALFVIALFVRQFMVRTGDRPLESIALTLFGVLYVAVLLNFATRMLMMWGPLDGRMLVLYMIVVVKSSDIGAYSVGCTLGRHKLIPRLSPAKTWEGCIGGVLTSVVVSVAFALAIGGDLGPVTLGIAHAVVLGILLAVVGMVGDLAESLVKRAVEVKDSGNLLKGMGGMLDVLDSLLFAFPVVYVYARLFLENAP